MCLEKLKDANKAFVWIMMERRLASGNSQEKFGEFGADRIKSYVGYFDKGEFIVKEIHSEFLANKTE